MSEPTEKTASRGQRVGYVLGPAALVLMLLLPAPEGLRPEAWRVAAVTVHMAIWWISEAIPIPATSLLPIALFPLLGVMPSAEAAAPYANHMIYLFMGGFFLAVTMERWDLHRRIALHTIRLVGTSPERMVLGFMVATAFLSMWVSNTATTMMMVPIGMAVIRQGTAAKEGEEATPAARAFGRSLMLGIAYSASIGGVGTIIGTPPNTVMVGMVEKMYGAEIGFARWMALAVPLSTVMLALTWYLLTRVLHPCRGLVLAGGAQIISRELRALGPMRREEKQILAVGCCAAALWLSRGFLRDVTLINELWPAFRTHVHDATIAIVGSVALFAIPTSLRRGTFLLDWDTALKIPWGVVILFGGGLAIAAGFAHTGLAQFIAEQLGVLEGTGLTLFVAIVVLATVFLTEITSNTATATLLVPIMGTAAVAMGYHPFATIVGACVAASFAFMLPVATPPNAVVFGSGSVTIRQMARTGLWINLAGAVLITLTVVGLLPLLWGVDLHAVPAWAR